MIETTTKSAEYYLEKAAYEVGWSTQDRANAAILGAVELIKAYALEELIEESE